MLGIFREHQGGWLGQNDLNRKIGAEVREVVGLHNVGPHGIVKNLVFILNDVGSHGAFERRVVLGVVWIRPQ